MSEHDAIDPAEVARTIPDDELWALHQVELAGEWFERAFGTLLEAHHCTGRAQVILLQAADALDEAGRGELARHARTVAALDAVHGRWTYQMVDEFRSHMLDPVRELDSRVRSAISGGVRHSYEANQKRNTEGVVTGTSVRPHPSAAAETEM
jgi:hypothetical protein